LKSNNLSSPLGDRGMTIIPAIDIINGKCVRLTQGDYAQQKVYNENPVEVAKQFEDAGITRLHVVDLDGAKAGTIIATIGSLAVKHPELLEEWLLEFGADKFLIGADVLDEKIKISGWLEDGGIDIFDFIGKMLGLGVTNIFCTDISKDGAMQGPSVELYKRIMAEHPEINLTASGGVTTMEDVIKLKEIGCTGAIIGKAIYEGRVPLNPLKGTLEDYSYFK
jgi:phosphoribosylformimino-5-aminoimidazole carboxamide ribotide isomerase